MGLRSLKEWNKTRSADVIAENTYPRPNGIACPECGGELMDSDNMILTSYPAQKNIKCSKCEFVGYRMA